MLPTPHQWPADGADEPVIPHTRTRQRHGRGASSIGLNLTAMIDVVFLLLVYFMVATQFKLGEEVYRLDLPERQAARQQRDPFELDEEPLRITVASSGVGPMGYRIRVEGPYPAIGTFQELFIFLRERQIGQAVTGGLFEPEHPVIIEPARSARWDHVIEAFNAAARARYTNVTLGKAG